MCSSDLEGKLPPDKLEDAQKNAILRLIEVAKKSHFRVGDASPGGQRGRGGKGGAKKQGPTCAACKKAKTVVLKTKAGKDWLKCEACGAKFWPDKDGKGCGKQWDSQ